jgi:GNAT superfamily N-acetyltransferase
MRADIVRYEPDDQPAVLAFRRRMYGPNSVFADAAYLQWMYQDPERTALDRSPLWLYRKNGQIEAHQGGIRVAVKVGAQQHESLWLLDLMVSPPFRLRGVGVSLAEVACVETELALGLEVSAAARKPLLRAGWIDVGTVPLYIRPLDVPAVLQQHRHSRAWRSVGHLGTVGLRTLEKLGLIGAALSRLEMIEVTQFDVRVDSIWEHASPAYPVICRRDQHFLNWRFARFPQPQRYRRFLFLCGHTPVGYAVLRMGDHHGLRAGFLVDFLCAPRWTPMLVARCLQFFRQQHMQIVYCLHHNPYASAVFSALGFVRRPSMWPLMARPCNLSPEQLALVQDQRNWFLTAADSDADRPREGTIFAADSWGTAH